jgi:dGTPase
MTGSGLAPYASDPARSRGRLHAEDEDATRSPFQRDRDRIIHSAAFRRLKYKTQVFVYHEGDNYRTRLTHSLEVAQIARSVCRYLRLNEDLAEALALAHDLGHTPFGHAGEEALDGALAQFGGFDHNAQALRIVTKLEHRYAEFDGLNLTWETLEGLVKHNGPLTGPHAANGHALPVAIAEYTDQHDLELDRFAGPEAQIAAVADDIAYNNHDIDDGLRAHLFAVEDLRGLPLVGPVIREVEAKYPGIEEPRLVHEVVRRLINAMVGDLIRETEARLAAAAPDSVAAVRGLDHAVAGFSAGMKRHDGELKEFLRDRMYRHYKVNRMTSKAKRVVRELYDLLFAEPECLPPDWRERAANAGEAQRARIVGDYIAGMTDRFALEEHQRLYDKYARV